MATIIRCECGAKVRIPRGPENRKFRCPKCKVGIAITIDARVLSSRRLGPGDPGAICPICQSPIQQGEMVVTCDKCDQVHHRECWAEIGGCGTYGCEEAPTLEKPETAATTPLSAWGDQKQCPACGETIKAIALRCRYCGTDFDTVDPLTLQDLRRKTVREEHLEWLKKTVIGLFAASVIGCFAPIVAIVGLALLVPKRKELARTGPVFVVMGYSAIILSVLYSLLMLVFAVV
ncbi:MAG: hypothetical protein GXP27_15350 [Planctomycetes bacterium]|nr:hypothetical protein [Planctomycetota bacterium]